MLLWLVLVVTRQEKRVWRIVVASTFGAVVSTLLLVGKLKYGILYVSISFLATFCMMILVCKKTRGQEIMTQTLYFFVLSTVFQELLQTIRTVWDMDNMIPALVGTVGLTMGISWFVHKTRRERWEQILYQVEIMDQGKHVEVTALLDTGNCLKDPFSKKPVSIVNKEQLKELWAMRRPEKSKIIPFYSVGKDGGILYGMEVEGMVIKKGEERIMIQKPIVAVYEGVLSQNKRYQMILHRELLE